MFKGKLFRFRNFNQFSILELNNKTLWFSNVASFNDPFEFKFNVSTEPPKSASDQFEFLKLTKEELESDTEKTDEEKDKIVLNYNDRLKLLPPEELKSYTKERLEEVVKNNVRHIIENDSTKVCCLSKKCDDPLMWAHYTDGMRGFVIIYNEHTTKDGKVIPALHVNYVDSVPTLDYNILKLKSQEDGFRLNTSILASKHHRWAYEEEIRLFSSIGHKYEIMNHVKLRNGGVMDLPDDAIYGVIIGYKMSEDNIRLIKDICTTHDYKLYMASANEQYGVDIKSI